MNSDGQLGQPGKRRREEEDTAATDRLTHLPEPILYHIVSFLDTKYAVRTAVLSRDWNRAWKHVPVLSLDKKSFYEDSDRFGKFVSKVLALRYDIKLRKLVYVDKNYAGLSYGKKPMERFAKVINYAFSHDVQHLVLEISPKIKKSLYSDFGWIFSEYCDSNDNNNNNNEKEKKENSNSLTTLDLNSFTLDGGFTTCSGFPMLTTLILKYCTLDTDQGLVVSANFHCLKNLAMTYCSTRSERIKVYGPHLRSLNLRGMESYEIEIFAPELRLFALCQNVTRSSKGFFDSALPALDRADISLTTWKLSYLDKTREDHYLNSLFQCLHSAKTLKMDGSTIEILNTMCEMLEPQPSPFERLESLILPSNDLQAKIIDYFFKASSCDKSNIIVRSLT